MPVPKRKRSRARRDKRFANKGMTMHAITSCANCDKPLVPHVACTSCGFYKGTKVLRTKVERSATRMSVRQAKKAVRAQKPVAQEE